MTEPSPHEETTPRPDPTRMTTDLVDRALRSFREVMETRLAGMDRASTMVAHELEKLTEHFLREIARIERHAQVTGESIQETRHREVLALREILETRLDGMDKAAELLALSVEGVPDDVEHSIASLREYLATRQDGADAATQTRLAGMDEATKLLASNVDKVPYAILQEAGNLKSFIMSRIDETSHVADEKFAGVERTFSSNALALTAALAAQKEAAAEQNKSNTLAITKSEQAQKETVGANQAQTTTGLQALSSNLQDLKERVVRLEAGGLARVDAHAENRADRSDVRMNASVVFGGIGLLIAVISIAVTILIATR